MIRIAVLILFLHINACVGSQPAGGGITLGAEQLDLILPQLAGKRVALLVNHTAMLGKTHLADTLLARGADIKKIFSPEHGFRGNADAGEMITHGTDPVSGLPIVSLYGNSKKPTAAQLSDVDMVIFDIQDVGLRFFTYISSLHYMMEACAENNKLLMILDRPNPNGSYVDGPVLEPSFQSFVGMHPIPVVHGMTLGEMAQMINGEGWLEGGVKCALKVISMKNYSREIPYNLPVKPSPNLPTQNAILWYPSICLFEGTVVSVGRGTAWPFEVIGNPQLKDYPFQFTPVSIAGMSKNPPHLNQVCYGLDLRTVTPQPGITLSYLIEFYANYPHKEEFFTPYFNTLAGTDKLKEQIISGLSEKEIKNTWQRDLNAFKAKRKKYLLYP